MKKQCNVCKKSLNISAFYFYKKWGIYYSKCKKCCLKQQKEYYFKNPQKLQERRKKDAERQRNISTVKRATYLKKWRAENKEKFRIMHNAHALVAIALKNGKLIKNSCKVCGVTRVHAHHTNYSKPLEIQWLCNVHHKEAHKKLSTS